MNIYNIISFIVLLAVAFALLVLWYLRQRSMGRTPYLLLKNDFKAIISHVLHELNVKAEWAKENDNQIVHYTYQGGHFNILLEKNSPYARLTFLYFYQADVDDLETVRVVCNLCNLNTDACRIVYTVDEKKGKVDVHLISVLPVNSHGMKEMLERVMGDAFRWQNTFSMKYDEQRKNDKKAGMDQELSKAQYERDIQIIREHEMTHQDAGPDMHESKADRMELRSILSTAMGLSDIIPIRLTLAVDDHLIMVDDPDEILGYKVSESLIEDGAFKHSSATGRLDFYDPRDPLTERHLTVDFEVEHSTADTLFYRVTLSLVPMSLDSNIGKESEQHSKQMTSVLLGLDLTPPEERKAHFRYVWKEAMAKQKSGDTENMTDEEKTLANIQDPHIGYNYYHGRSLYMHRRYYEALLPLLNAYHSVSQVYDHHDHHVVDMLDELAYFIGCCYMCLHQYDRACYYLQQTLPTSHQSYTEAYINCLVNGGDYRAMDIISGLLSSLQMLINHLDEDDDEDEHMGLPNREQLERFVNFVKRRKAYMLVSLGRYDEAERLLKQLLDDPDNSDFALSELAYIQKHK